MVKLASTLVHTLLVLSEGGEERHVSRGVDVYIVRCWNCYSLH